MEPQAIDRLKIEPGQRVVLHYEGKDTFAVFTVAEAHWYPKEGAAEVKDIHGNIWYIEDEDTLELAPEGW